MKVSRGARYCSTQCRNAAYKARYHEANKVAPEGNLNVGLGEVTPNTRASINELLVSADLMRRGFHVYRALAPGSPCNLVMLRAGVLERVEVRAVVRTPSGKLMRPNVAGKNFDVLALVERDGTIHYEPPLAPA